jgi:predicted nicotinamide N-methyase
VSTEREAFIRSHLQVAPVAFVPEISLYQAEEPIGLWELTEGEAFSDSTPTSSVEYHSDQPPPFWAFAWAGGQALARYLLDHPADVAGRAVLDLASGSGLTAVAARRAGARTVRAVEIEPMAGAAIGLNAAANNVAVEVAVEDVLDRDPGDVEIVLAGDVFYSKTMAERMLTFMRRAARAGVDVLVGDPGRAYFPTEYFARVTEYEIPVRYELESTRVKSTTIWRIHPRGAATPPSAR